MPLPSDLSEPARPLDLDALAPVALWRRHDHWHTCAGRAPLLGDEFRALPVDQHYALVAELREAMEALRFYADPRSYESVVSYRPYRNGATLETVFGPSPVGTDEGKKARTALAGKGGDRG